MFIYFLLIFLILQFKHNELEALNQRTQEILRKADATNHQQIEAETAQLNADWNKKLTDLENHIETIRGLCEHWQGFDKRVHSFENQLTRLDERNRNVDLVVKSKQHLDDTKNVYQVSDRFHSQNR